MFQRGRRRWWVLALIPLLLVAGFVFWAISVPAPMPEAMNAMDSTTEVAVEAEEWLIFRPVDMEPDTGLVLYPGGRVDPRSYAPAAQAIAAEGFLVAIVSVRLNLAVLSPERANEVIEAFPEIEQWAIGGHSLGGVMAARYADRHPELIDGVVLWAAYPAEGNDLSASDLEVLSLYGTRDGLTTLADIEASRYLLPEDATVLAIEGGNHAQFGWYGAQEEDLPATISREAQQAQIVEATAELLRSITE